MSYHGSSSSSSSSSGASGRSYGGGIGSSRSMQRSGSNCSIEVKNVNVCSLNKLQQVELMRHASHHTQQHIQVMVNGMRDGLNFAEAHELAMEKVGK